MERMANLESLEELPGAAYFFENIQTEIIRRIEAASKNVRVAVTWFTNHDIFDTIIKKLEEPSFEVDLIVLNDRINNKKEGLDFQKLIDKGGRFYYSTTDQMVHHKFCIVDDEVVVTGSYNWTYYAEKRNWENVVVIQSAEIAMGYVAEYQRIVDQHEQVKNVAEKQSNSFNIVFKEILSSDYQLHAEIEEKRGNEIKAAKIYTELLKMDKKQPSIVASRKRIIEKINRTELNYCPFEIGVHFQSGYHKLIPSFSKIPLTINKGASTVSDNQRNVEFKIQRFDYFATTILTMNLKNIKPMRQGEAKLEVVITIGKDGILRGSCKELNGYGRTDSATLDLNKFLR